MKKNIIALALIGIVSLTGCSSAAFTGEKVGEVTNDKGDVTIATVEFEEGTPVSVGINVKTSNGMKYELSEEGTYDMQNDGLKWHEQTDAVEAALVENGFDFSKIAIDEDGKTDAITGVTVAINEYLEAVKIAIDAAK